MRQEKIFSRLPVWAALLAAMALGLASLPAPGESTAAWSEEALDQLEILPIQDGGRVKPLSAFARSKLLKMNGRRVCKTPDGEKLSATAWLADCLFRPERARTYKMFRVDNAEVLVAIGVPHEKKRDRYSYNDLAPGLERLFKLTHDYGAVSERERSPVQAQIVNLTHNVHEFETLAGFLDFAKCSLTLGGDARLASLFPEKATVGIEDVLRQAPALLALLRNAQDDAQAQEGLEPLLHLFHTLDNAVTAAESMALFPPADPAVTEWYTPADVIQAAFGASSPRDVAIADLGALAELARSSGQPVAFTSNLAAFQGEMTKRAEARKEYGSVPLEAFYYRAQFFHFSLMLYVLSFVLIAFSWLKPGSRLLRRINLTALCVPTLLAVAGITLRCIIRGRPPVTTLYETILFVAVTAVVVCLFIEVVNRQGIGMFLAAAMGMAGLFLANKYELKEGADTMPSMVAVLDTNFWLATHVTTITIGYAAGILASAFSHVFVLAKLTRFREKDPLFYTQLTRMVYGVLCFSLLFSIVGTVLGGIWANESWGRFWGWDPKENGALMIVLCQLAILHARLGGYIRGHGLHLAVIFGGVIVIFSWFGVNLLGVGLHTYGFTSGVYKTLMLFYGVELFVLILGGAAWTNERRRRAAQPV